MWHVQLTNNIRADGAVVHHMEDMVTVTMTDGGQLNMFSGGKSDVADVPTFVATLTGMHHKMSLSTDP